MKRLYMVAAVLTLAACETVPPNVYVPQISKPLAAKVAVLPLTDPQGILPGKEGDVIYITNALRLEMINMNVMDEAAACKLTGTFSYFSREGSFSATIKNEIGITYQLLGSADETLYQKDIRSDLPPVI